MRMENISNERQSDPGTAEMGKISMRSMICLLLLSAFALVSLIFIEPEEQKMESEYKASDLQKVVTRDGNVTRTDYVDESGIITVATDLGYSTVISTKEDNITTEIYLDDEGNSTNRKYQTFFGIRREYDDEGNNIRITYLDREGNPKIIGDGYAIEEREYKQKRFIASRYYDADYQPVRTAGYGCGRRNEYDEKGRISRVTYVDEAGNPVMTSQGYASYTREYLSAKETEGASVTRDMYFNENGEPAQQSLGYYGVENVKDGDGRVTRITYLDADGKPAATNKGYTSLTRSYHADGHINTEQYFDADGNPYALSEGQYGYQKAGDKITYLNETGDVKFNIRNLMYNRSWIVVPLTVAAMIALCWIPRKACIGLVLAYIGVIGYFTLLFRESTENGVVLSAFWSYRKLFTSSGVRSEILKNIWLFVPLGALLYRACPKLRVILIPVIISIVIEGIQYFAGLGQCEFDDVLSNGIGSAIGFWGQRTLMEFRRCKLLSDKT